MDKEMLKGSHLLFWLNKLNIVSKESTNSGFDFDSFNKYMHVNREIQDDLIQTISTINSRSENHLIFFAGSSGDGKSHTFSYLRENHEELIEEYEFYRDATESDDLDLEAEEVLEKKLIEFSDDKVMTNTGSKTIIAINLGILSNLIMVPTVKKNYSKMVNFVHESGVLEEGSTKRVVIGNNFSIVNFSGYNDLDFLEEELIYLYLEQIFEKVFSENENNIFYNAYKNDIDNGIIKDYIVNYQIMLNETVRKNVIKLLITAKLNKNLIIPTRMIFDFIYRILVPSNKSSEVTSETMTDFLNNTMVNLLFTNISKGKLLKPIQELDVLKYRTKQADSIISELSVKDLSVICAEYLSDIKFRIFCNKLEEADNLSRISDFDLKKQFVKVIIRMIWLSGSSNFDEYYEMYNKYVYFLKGYNEKNVSVIKELVDFVYKAIFSWLGDEHSLYVQASKTQNVSLSYQLNIEDAFQDLPCRIPNASIFTSLQVPFKEKETEVSAVADIDYTLFCLLYRINSGYRPNKQDEENAVSFVNFMKKLVKAGQNKKQLILSRDANSFEYVLKKGKKLGEDVYEFGRKI